MSPDMNAILLILNACLFGFNIYAAKERDSKFSAFLAGINITVCAYLAARLAADANLATTVAQ